MENTPNVADSDSSEYSGLEDEDSTDSEEEEVTSPMKNGKPPLSESVQLDSDSESSDDENELSEKFSKSDKEGHDVTSPIKSGKLPLSKSVQLDLDSESSDEENELSEKFSQKSDKEDHEVALDELTNAKDLSVKAESLKSSQNPPLFDEYANDTSDEEDIRNTVGNIPMKWYDDFPHIGYDIQGQKILKPASTDEIDEFLSKIDDPNYWRTVKNKMTGEKVFLTDEDIDLIHRIQSGRYPTGEDQCQPFEDFFTYETMKHPVTNQPPHKRSFTPSRIEKEKVSKLVYAIKMGWIRPRVPKEKKDDFYLMWDKDMAEESRRLQHYIPPPKRKLPGHAESYNPPPEYLFTHEEEEEWKEEEPERRKLNFIPKRYSNLREVPAYPQYINEWFERCLDLYLCPRERKMRANVDPNDLIPRLPKPKDLQPFPTVLSIVFTGHSALVRTISVESSGQFMASGSDDESIKIWEVLTGRCLSTINIGGQVKSLAWCPNEALCLLSATIGEKLFIINPKVGDKVVISNTDSLLGTFPENPADNAAEWMLPSEEQKSIGIRLIIVHSKELKQVVWHAKGDYFAALVSDVGVRSIVIHQLSKFRSQIPFRKLKGNVQCVSFHPLRPFFFVATQKYIRMYNLLKQEISKLLSGNCQWISSMAVHPQGDNIIVGTYDTKLSWFDLELSTKPYKTLRHHKKAVRQVVYHKRYPLFASCSDDGNVIICHGMVYSDLLQNPMIIPVKILKEHGVCLDCCFHPQRPWIFSTSDNVIRLYS